MKDVTHAGQLKVLQDLLKIKETDGILRGLREQRIGLLCARGLLVLPDGREGGSELRDRKG